MFVNIMAFRYYDPEQVGGLLVFEGSRRQRGGNFIDTLKGVAAPLGKLFARKAKTVGRDLAKRGVRAGVGAIRDRLQGNSTTMKEALKRRATAAADRVIEDYLGPDGPDLPIDSQDGRGLRRRKKKRQIGRVTKRRKKTINKTTKRRVTKRGTKKRRKRQSIRDIFS